MSCRDIFQTRQSAWRKAVCFHLNVIIMSVDDKGMGEGHVSEEMLCGCRGKGKTKKNILMRNSFIDDRLVLFLWDKRKSFYDVCFLKRW